MLKNLNTCVDKHGRSLAQLLQKLAASATQALYERFMSKHVYILSDRGGGIQGAFVFT